MTVTENSSEQDKIQEKEWTWNIDGCRGVDS